MDVPLWLWQWTEWWCERRNRKSDVRIIKIIVGICGERTASACRSPSGSLCRVDRREEEKADNIMRLGEQNRTTRKGPRKPAVDRDANTTVTLSDYQRAWEPSRAQVL